MRWRVMRRWVRLRMCCGRCLGSIGRRSRFRRWTALYRLPARESGYWPPLGGNFSNSLSIALSSFWVFFPGWLESVSLAAPDDLFAASVVHVDYECECSTSKQCHAQCKFYESLRGYTSRRYILSLFAPSPAPSGSAFQFGAPVRHLAWERIRASSNMSRPASCSSVESLPTN
jgi:hypothetical protein